MNIGPLSTFVFSALTAATFLAGCSPRTTDHVKERGATDPVAELAGNMVSIPGKNYAICKFEVTQALWFAVMGKKPSRFKGADLPVENVSWDDCQQFLWRLNALPEVQASGYTYRIPTADEWVFACLAGATGDFCRLADRTTASEWTLGSVAWHSSNSGGKAHPVGQKKPNAFGLYDMHGNVKEWTTKKGDIGVSCHGGSWRDKAFWCGASKPQERPIYESTLQPTDRRPYLGFRLAADNAANPAMSDGVEH